MLMRSGKPDAVAQLFKTAWWVSGLACPNGSEQNVTKHCRYGRFQRCTCKNYKAGTILHLKQANLGEQTLSMQVSYTGQAAACQSIASSNR